MTTTPDYAHPVRPPRKSIQGVVMGTDPWQLTLVAALIQSLYVPNSLDFPS